MIGELYKTQGRLKRLREDLESINLDRGQTFGKHLDAFKENGNSGDAALRDEKYFVAKGFYKDAETAYDWIIKNIPLRREAAAAGAVAKESQKKALACKSDVKTRAKMTWGYA